MKKFFQFRQDNEEEFAQSRQELRWLARENIENPWNEEFAEKLKVSGIPKFNSVIDKKLRDSWINSSIVRLALKAGSLTVAAPSATISLVFSVMSLLPVAVATEVLGLISDYFTPGAELAIDWKMASRWIWEKDCTT